MDYWTNVYQGVFYYYFFIPGSLGSHTAFSFLLVL